MVTKCRHGINISCRTMRIFSCALCCSVHSFQLHFIYIYSKFSCKIHIIQYYKLTFCQCISIRPTHKMIPFVRDCLYLYLGAMLEFSFTFHRTILTLQCHSMHIGQKYSSQIRIGIERNRTSCIGTTIRPFRKDIAIFCFC